MAEGPSSTVVRRIAARLLAWLCIERVAGDPRIAAGRSMKRRDGSVKTAERPTDHGAGRDDTGRMFE